MEFIRFKGKEFEFAVRSDRILEICEGTHGEEYGDGWKIEHATFVRHEGSDPDGVGELVDEPFCDVVSRVNAVLQDPFQKIVTRG